MSSVHNLSDEQRLTLRSLADLTNGGDDSAMIGVLDSVEWNLERAASLIFDHGASIAGPSSESTSNPAHPEATASTARHEFEIDDSEQNNLPVQPAASMTSIIAYPFAFLSSLFRFLFRFLPFRFIPFTFSRIWSNSPPKGGQSLEDWARSLEEELGASTITRQQAESSAVDPSTSTSGLTQRGGVPPATQRILPDFESRLSYEDFLRKCIQDSKIGCIILISEESDDAEPFKRNTLSNPSFVHSLRNNDILVWAGPTHLLEPYKASLKLSSTTYPFVAFVSLQPRRHSPRSRFSEGSLTILSRHQGSDKTIADKLVSHIENTIIPRVTPHLQSIRQEKEEAATRKLLEKESHAAERRLRAEQDAAYERAAERDRDRIERKRREVDEAKRRALQEEEDNAIELQRMTSEVSHRMGWRLWEEHHFGESSTMPLVNENGGIKPMRLVLRMHGVEGKVWLLPPSTSLTSLYARIDALLPSSASDILPIVPSFVSSGEDAQAVLESHLSSLPMASSFFPFGIHLAYPRIPIPWIPRATLADVDELRKGGGGVVVVEMTGGSSRTSLDGSRQSFDGVDSDGYESEE